MILFDMVLKNLNSIGLLFDLLGIILVAYSFKNIRREKNKQLIFGPEGEGVTKAEKEHKKLIYLDRIGTSLLVMGFTLQIVSNYIKL